MRYRFAVMGLIVIAGACVDPGPAPPDEPPVVPPADPFVRTQIDPTVGSRTTTAALAEAGGRIHVVYSTDGRSSLRYAVCDGLCDSASSWRWIEVDTAWSTGYHPTLAQGPTGSLHATYAAYQNATGWYYAECPGTCAESSHWQTVAVDRGFSWGSSLTVGDDGIHALYVRPSASLGAQWYVRLASCVANCAAATSWTTTPFDSSTFFALSPQAMHRDAAGVLHAVYLRRASAVPHRPPAQAGPMALAYAWCAASCSAPAGWTSITLDSTSAFGIQQMSLGPRLEFAPTGPRVLYWEFSASPVPKIAACDSGCAAPASWRFVHPAQSPPFSPDLAFAVDGSGGMHVVLYPYVMNDNQLTYYSCPVSCGLGDWATLAVLSSSSVDGPSIVAAGARVGIVYGIFGGLFFATPRRP